jgi:hypothetical protein
MSKAEFKNGQVLGIVVNQGGEMETVKVRHGGEGEEFQMGISTFADKQSLPLRGEGIQYAIPSLEDELSSR